ncbi:MAG TPA: OmpA family protein [bacterium]|nr:OmpA family protein [bacterium]
MERALRLVVGVLAVFFLALPSAWALNVQLLRPSTGHVQGYQLFTSETLPKYKLATGLNVNYAHHPLELTVTGTTSRSLGVVDRFVTADFLVSYGLTNWWTVNVDMPVNIYHDIAPTFIATRDQGGGDAGDLSVNMKFRIFDANKTSTGLGLAIVPFITVPTGRQSIFFGDENLTGGGILVGDAQWKSNRFYINVGGRIREAERIINLSVNEELLYGLGFERPLAKKAALDIIIELFGATNFSKFASENISSPIEGLVVLKKKWLENRNLITQFGGGFGITNGYGVPTYRALMGVSYAWDLKSESAPLPPPAVRQEVITTNKIHFAYDKADILASSYPVLDEIVATIKSRPAIRHVRVEGHTDSRGADAYNQKLSERRANAVRGYLVAHGIPEEKVEAVGMGETTPIADNATKAGRSQNRRVEFHLEVAEGAGLKVQKSTQEAPTYEEGESAKVKKKY